MGLFDFFVGTGAAQFLAPTIYICRIAKGLAAKFVADVFAVFAETGQIVSSDLIKLNINYAFLNIICCGFFTGVWKLLQPVHMLPWAREVWPKNKPNFKPKSKFKP